MQLKKNEIYHRIDYANLCFFCHQIESDVEEWSQYEKYNKAKRLIGIEEVDA